MGKNKSNEGQTDAAVESKLLAPPLTPEQQVERNKQIRVEQCNAEIAASLAKYKCQLVPITTITRGQIEQVLQLVAV